MSELVRTERRDHIFEIMLDRPEKRNAISIELFEQFDAAVREVEKAVGVRCVLIQQSIDQQPDRLALRRLQAGQRRSHLK